MVKIFIDPGHGGSDPGAVGNGLKEKDLVLTISRHIRDMLLAEYKGVSVKMSRDSDVYPTFAERANMANNWGADYFCSIHINAAGGTGFETFIHNSRSTKSVAYQNVMHSAILAEMDVRDRGKKDANFAVLRLTKMPAILTENLFIDNTHDAKLLKDAAFLKKVARGHVEGFAKAFKLKGGTSKPDSSKLKGGDSVIRAIQEFINSYGFEIKADGIAGPETMRGLIMVLQTELNKQFAAGLQVDGILGPKTEAAFVNVRVGARGNLTKVLQALLYINGYDVGTIDGIFGNKTEKAVRSFQKGKGLSVDGVAGRNTWRALL
ncbi:N-acetylmuramoyl-L-alanine amidase [Shouchella clausii]|uniref:N-acetylmuramoyl-L-alanine amidase n=1 Tax=Shouchella clausii TaxID=79880 RepID=UPI0028A1619E|nr:N-acetylmuramoyl-L-alanine amidase [Shouchella clausii]